MLPTRMEVLVELAKHMDKQRIEKIIQGLKDIEGVKDVVFCNGAFVVETTLTSTVVLDLVTAATGNRAVLQGFGDSQSAVAMVTGENPRRVMGVVRLQQKDGTLVADGSLDGLEPNSVHGIHVHEAGDITEGCKSLGPHFNPSGAPHGGPDDAADKRHAGDLGNITVDKSGRATFKIEDKVLKLADIVGRSIGISEREDDLGKGNSPNSLVDGNSGPPIACGIIARSAGVFENPKRICACDGVVVWDEKDRPLAGAGRRDASCTQCEKDSKSVTCAGQKENGDVKKETKGKAKKDSPKENGDGEKKKPWYKFFG